MIGLCTVNADLPHDPRDFAVEVDGKLEDVDEPSAVAKLGRPLEWQLAMPIVPDEEPLTGTLC